MPAGRRSVAFVQREIKGYRVPFLVEIRRRLEERHVDLTLVHTPLASDEDTRGDNAALEWATTGRAYPLVVGSRRLLWQSVPRQVWTSDLIVVEQASQLLLNFAMLLRRRLGGPRIAFWGHATSPYPDANPVGEYVKRRVATQPDWWFAYTDGVADEVSRMGFPPERISSINNSTDTKTLSRSVKQVSIGELQQMRDTFGIRGDSIGLFIGGLVQEKQLGFLVKAGEAIRSEIDDFELVVAGNGPLSSWVESVDALYPWLHYIGPRYDHELAVALRLSSFLLIPAWAGLAITDGLAAGRPPVVSGAAPHGPELHYLRSGENGLVVNDYGDPARFASAVIALIRAPGELATMQRNCSLAGQSLGTEAMANHFVDGCIRAISLPRRSRRSRRGRL